ncbi:hypothetical protein TNCV_654351, partial [Trichonephila clavipes]
KTSNSTRPLGSKSKPMQEKQLNSSKVGTKQLINGENNSTQHERNNSTEENKTTQLGSMNRNNSAEENSSTLATQERNNSTRR